MLDTKPSESSLASLLGTSEKDRSTDNGQRLLSRLMLILLAVIGVLLFVWGTNQASQVKRLKERLKPITDADRYSKLARVNADSLLAEAKVEADEIVSEAKGEHARLEAQIRELNERSGVAKRELEVVEEGLRLKSDDAHLLEVGYYQPIYGYEDIDKFQKAILKIKEKQKAMLRIGGETGDKTAAAYATERFIFNNSEEEGRKWIKKILQLLLRAFNGECDVYIARANYRNIATMQKRINSSFDQLNKLASTWNCQISKKYLSTRLEELSLVFEYAELEQKIKEEQAWIREQERESEKARREAERKERDAAKRQAGIEKAVKDAEEALKAASEKDKAVLRNQIEELQRQLEEAQKERARAKSLAEQTKAGFVYVFSNIGSFGENVYKIGMTRREDPEERRRELGDASVPFPFDCHAYIWTEDAPALEHALHQHFDAKRLNLENPSKEFFPISIQEIQEEIEDLKTKLGINAEIRWTLLAEAKDFRLSQAKRKHLEDSLRKPAADKNP